jgi:hypothetical protein
MDEALLAAYRATDYRVRLRHGGWTSIRVDIALPEPLRALINARAWAFVTAWNPHSQLRSSGENRLAQRALLRRLRALPGTVVIQPAIGVGADGWREPSLFVIGLEPAWLDGILDGFGQNGYVHGRGDGPARLRLLRA